MFLFLKKGKNTCGTRLIYGTISFILDYYLIPGAEAGKEDFAEIFGENEVKDEYTRRKESCIQDFGIV